MTSMPPRAGHLPASTLLITGAVFTVVGGIIGIGGAALTAVGAVRAVRRRIERMDVPPAELARREWQRARTAVTAWRDGQTPATLP